jgi:hypothetical protein
MSDMIAPTAGGCKRAWQLNSRDGSPVTPRLAGNPICTADPGRHGIVSGIIILPNFRPSTALVGCDKQILRWPGPFGSGFLSPQPPGAVGIGPVRRDSLSQYWANESWSFFFLGIFQTVIPGRASARTRNLISNNFWIPGPRQACHRAARCADPLDARPGTTAVAKKFSAATYTPPQASGPVCRDCRPGDRPPRHRRRRG